MLLADLDRDNDLDAIVSGTSSNIVTLSWNRGDGVFENRVDYPAGVPVYATVGDFDGDSWPDVAVAGWGGSVTILYSPGEGSPTIVNVTVGQNPRSITALDLEGDGDLDLAVTRYSAGTVALLVNTGGVFALGSEVPARPAKSITAADIDADGRPDLITGSHEGYVTILRQTGAGGFARTDLSAGGVVSMAVAVDLNGDGRLDLATANEDNSASVLLNLGGGAFAPRVLYTVGNLAQSLDTGDIDDDGDMDLVVANYSQSTASILLNNGAGAFPEIQAFAAGERPRDVVVGDVNGDGQLDLATSNDQPAGSFAIVLNTAIVGNEGFLPAVSYPTGMTPYAIALGDLDRDGDPDAIVSCAVARAITVSMNQGNGTFASRVDYPAGLAVHAAVGDFDGDSWPDVAVADWDGTVRVMRFVNGSLVSSATVSLSGNPRAVVAVDLDGDGDLDLAVARHGIQDVALLSNSGGAFTHTGTIPVPQPKSVTAADLDSDGVPEVISGSPQGSVSILKRNTAGSYVATTLTMGSLVSMVVAADLDGDGHLDLATANESSTASVRMNLGNGTFAPRTNYTIGPLAQSLGVGDVDVDGDPDLIVASYTAQSVRVLYNFGGVFPANLDFATDGRPRGLVVGDVNGDGAPDLAAANETALGSFAILINKEYGGVTLTPAAGAPGMVVRIRALGLNGTSEVWFGETPAMFQVVADTLVEAEVPEGARTGPVRVHTPLRVIHGPVFIVSPMILSFVPTVAPAGGAVTLSGYNFATVDTVRFNGALALFTIVSDEEIQTEVPLDATDGPITAWNPGGTGTSAGPFDVAPFPAPQIIHYTPSAMPGDTVTILGHNLGRTMQVSFNGAVALFTVISDEQIEATVPPAATSGPLFVTNPGGTVSAGLFIVGPRVLGINLSWNDCGVAGDSVKTFACDTNTGVDHLVATFVPPRGINRFVGLSADLRIAATSLPDWWKHGAGQCRPGGSLVPEFDVPGEACATAWPGTQAGGFSYELGSYGANTARLRLQAAVPSEEAFALVDGLEYYAFRVRVARAKTTGAGSCAGCLVPVQVRLENIQLFQPADANRDPLLDAPIHGATAYWQGITGAQPQIASITPAAGPPGAGVTILGAGLSAASAVRFGNTEAVFAQVSDSQLSATIPGGARTAPVRVTTPFGSAVGGGDFIVSPEIDFFLPEQGPEGSEVTIFGHNFGTATAIAFHGVPAAYVIQTDTSIVATVPAGATEGPITVTNPGGATASFESFRLGPSAGVFNLSWDECGLAGGEIKTFACNTNSGSPFTLVASFAPPANVTEVTGLSADIRVSSPVYPDWWKFGLGACRPGSQLFASAGFATNGACSDLLHSNGASGSSVGYTASYYGPGTARLSILMSFPAPSATLDPTREYYGFKLNIGRQRTVSDGACAHCDRPVALALEQIRIHRAGGAEDVAITSTFRRSAALWQGTPQPPPDLSSFSPPGGDVGAQVDLHGVRFAGVTSVRFGAVEAEFTINSNALITALVPEGTASAPIEITSVYGSDVSQGPFIFAPDIRDVAADPSSDETRARNEIPEVLALDRVAWDAGASALAVTVALPRTGPASFEMFDVSGRRLAGQRLDGLGAGTHELSLRPSVPLRPGVHFVRLTLNRETVSRRFVVVQ